MQSTIRVTEFYDVIDVKNTYTNATLSSLSTTEIPLHTTVVEANKKVVPPSITNTFSGFNNFPIANADSSIQNPNALTPQSQYTAITGQVKAPQAQSNISISEDGAITCYPPNVSVPYWNRIIFRTFDYEYNPKVLDDGQIPPTYSYNPYIDYLNTFAIRKADAYYDVVQDDVLIDGLYANQTNPTIYNYDNAPLFVKYDQYQSRSKVVFASTDRNHPHDIEFKFGYQHGQMEPIRLTLSPTANNPFRDQDSANNVKYNQHYTRKDMEELLTKCYWSIEWIYDPPTKE